MRPPLPCKVLPSWLHQPGTKIVCRKTWQKTSPPLHLHPPHPDHRQTRLEWSDKNRVAKKLRKVRKQRIPKGKNADKHPWFSQFSSYVFPGKPLGVRASTPCSRTRRGLSTIIQGQKLRNGLLTLLKQKYFWGESSMIQSKKKKRLRLEVAAQKRCQHPIKHEFSISKCISGQLQVNKNLSSRALPWFLANNDIHVEKGVDLDLPWSPAM